MKACRTYKCLCYHQQQSNCTEPHSQIYQFGLILVHRYLLTTPIMPNLTGMTLPINMSIASVPASIRSSLVTTASVLLPEHKDIHACLKKHCCDKEGKEHITRGNKTTIKWSKSQNQRQKKTTRPFTISVNLTGHFKGL